MAKPKEISILKESPIVHIKSTFGGKIKKIFIEDLERGYKASELIRQMADKFYEGREPKNRY